MNLPEISSSQTDYTSGSMRRNLWDLSWPMTFSMLLFALPSLLDGVWLGKLGFDSLAAAGLAMSLRIAMISPLMALNMAGGAVVARYVGARDQENADKAMFHVVVLIFRLFYCIKDEIGLSFCHYDRNDYSNRTHR